MATDLVQTSCNLAGKADSHTGVKWCPPPAGVVKVNVDASFNPDTLQGATGVVARNDQGQVISVSSRWYENIPDVITAEAFACRDGADMVGKLNLTNVILETDNMEVAALWKSRAKNRSRILPLLYQIEELSRPCISFEINHVRREANMDAHYTAKNASPSNDVSTWMHQVPEFLYTCIQHDISC
jgi:hypothetical protein